jgi:hypothetical protein
MNKLFIYKKLSHLERYCVAKYSFILISRDESEFNISDFEVSNRNALNQKLKTERNLEPENGCAVNVVIYK